MVFLKNAFLFQFFIHWGIDRTINDIFSQAVFVASIALWVPLQYVNYTYSLGGNLVGMLLSLASMVWVPVYFLYYVISLRRETGELVSE